MNCYVHMHELHFTATDDIKKIMMDDYVRKDAVKRHARRARPSDIHDSLKIPSLGRATPLSAR